MFKNILVPYDGSKFAKHAFKVSFGIAQKYGSKINLVVCVETFGSSWYTKYYSDRMIVKLLEKKMQDDITNFKSIATKKGITIQSRIIETSSVVRTMVNFVKSNKIDLVVIGAHGRGVFDRLILGSVVDGIAHHVRCPVLIIK